MSPTINYLATLVTSSKKPEVTPVPITSISHKNTIHKVLKVLIFKLFFIIFLTQDLISSHSFHPVGYSHSKNVYAVIFKYVVLFIYAEIYTYEVIN